MEEFTKSLIVIIILCFILRLYLKYHFDYWNRRDIPHPPPRILTGNMFKWKRHQHFSEIFDETYEKYKGSAPFAGFFFNMQKAVIVLDVAFARNILINNFSSFEDRGFFHNEKDDPLTANLLLLDGMYYNKLKTKILSLFVPAKIKYVFPSVLKVGEELQTVFAEAVAESKDRILDVHFLLGRYTLDVIANCVFGRKVDCLRNHSNPFYVMVRSLFSQRRHTRFIDSLINCFPDWAKFFHIKQIPEHITQYFTSTCEKTVREREKQKVKKSDFMDLLIELKHQPFLKGGGYFSQDELTALAFSFFITSYDTCMATMSFVLFELACNPIIQQKLRDEIKAALRAHKRKLTYDCMMELKYLDQIISETLRKYPAVPALFRKCTKRYTPNNSHFYIEKGTTIIIPTLSFHYDSRYFEDPTKFDPERFSSGRKRNIKPGTYLPYGDGQRKCLGNRFAHMIMSVALIKLVSNFRFESCSQTKNPIEIVIPCFNLSPLDIKLKITKI